MKIDVNQDYGIYSVNEEEESVDQQVGVTN